MLDDILLRKKKELDRIDQAAGIECIKQIVPKLSPASSLKQSLRMDAEVSLIAEIKRRSPSKGVLVEHLSVEDMVRCYQRGGARAISVLTDRYSFGGSIDDLMTAKHVSDLPVLRKDFILEEYQIWESRLIGADAILLIVAILTPQKLSHFHSLARQIGLEALVEVHTREELETALAIKPEIVGINNRNLATFKVDLSTTELLRPYIPDEIVCISESGIGCRDDMLHLQACKVDAALVGEKIVVSPEPQLKIRELLGIEP